MAAVTSSLLFFLLQAALRHAVGQNLTIQDGESIVLTLPPGSAQAPADVMLATFSGANEAAAAIPILALDKTVQGRVALVIFLVCESELTAQKSSGDPNHGTGCLEAGHASLGTSHNLLLCPAAPCSAW